MNRDLTVGSPRKVLWLFCLPLFGSVVFQQLYNIADSFVAGKLIGENALAAVGNSYEITLIFIAFAFGCNIGCSVTVARLFGAGDTAGVKTAVRTALLAAVGLCLLLMAAGFLCKELLLELIHTPEDVFQDSALYLTIYIFGLPFVFLYNLATGVFSALGDSRTPFYFLAASSVSNIAVDILFVSRFHMGVPGVAWATFLCQGVSCALALLFLAKRLSKIRADRKGPLFSWGYFKEISVIAVPSILQQSFISVGNIMIQGVINQFGAGVMAGYSASVKLNNLVITSFTTLGNGISNFTAQNLGAQKKDRVREGFRSGLQMVWMICVPLVLLYLLIPGPLMQFFMKDPSPTAMNAGVLFLRILSPFYFVVSAKLVADGVLRGAGRMKAFMASTFSDLILRVTLSFLLSATFLGSTGIWCAWPIGWSIGTLLSLLFYGRFQKK